MIKHLNKNSMKTIKILLLLIMVLFTIQPGIAEETLPYEIATL